MVNPDSTVKPTTIQTSIAVFGSFDPAAFTSAVSLTPTRSFRAGERRGGSSILRYSEDSWRLVVCDRASVHLDEELGELLTVLRPAAAQFRAAVRSLGLCAQASFYVRVEDQRFPSISLSPDYLRQLAELEMSIDIDII